jgi:hypothetical protein
MALGDFFPGGSSLWTDKSTFLPSSVPSNQKLVATEVNQFRDALYDLRTATLTRTTDFVVYVDAVNGSDAYDGLTSVTALRNLDTAFARLPMFWTAKCRIILASGTYATTYTTLNLGGPLGPVAEPLLIAGPMADSGLATRTAAAGSTTTVINVSGAALTADAHYGMRIRFTSGTQSGQTRTVVANTTSSITVNYDFGIAPGAGDSFVLEVPGATITMGGNLYFSTASGGSKLSRWEPSIVMYGVKWTLPVSGSLVFNGGSTAVWFDACSFDLHAGAANAVIVQYHARCRIRETSALFPTISNSTFGVASYFYNGVLSTFASGLVLQFGALSDLLTVVMDTCAIDLNCYAYGNITAAYIRKGGVAVDYHSTAVFNGACTIDGMNLVGNLVYVRKNSTLDFTSFSCVFKNSTSHGLYFESSNSSPSQGYKVRATGTGNAGYGIYVDAMSTVSIDPATTITGTSGDIRVGGTTTTHANLTSVGFVTDANFLSRVSRT